PGGVSLAKQVEHALAGQAVRRLVVVAPFFDRALRGLDALREALSPEEVSFVLQPEKVSLPGEALVGAPVTAYRFAPEGGQRSARAYLHAKLYLLETDDREYCLWGSPNCSAAALAGQGNFETALLAKGPKGHFLDRLGLGPSLADAARIDDPRILSLREAEGPKRVGAIQLTSVEFANGDLEAT